MAANDKQISGEHYKKQTIQSWDFIAANGFDFFQGSAITYIGRFRDKGGRRDLEKAIHFIEKLIELEYPDEPSEEIRVGVLVGEEIRPSFVVGDEDSTG